ncbi:hypothetical protein [Streptomyces sp. A012304]|uniref:hypothetical protein n=1 Tax=Streptomyces sp. A012304 TaxID=375446 RepID=UPI00222F95B6|nr:hypothetical protein [Streptomyces sp. A012304]GKQ38704.1 hypothetical protein ALMP_52350 [Streptomyces sp. A012304]
MGRRVGWATVVGVVFCLVTAVLRAPVALAAGSADAPSYAFADDARGARAASGTNGAVRLEPGETYRSSLDGSGKAYYRLELDAEASVYVSVTAVPRRDALLAAGDGISVSVQSAAGANCSFDSVTVGASGSARPITAWGAREILVGKGLCQEAGTYYAVVERAATAGDDGTPWDLELAPVSEPFVRQDGGATRQPEVWNSATPAPVAGEPVRRPGGAGFARAAAVRQGVWRDEITPGQTLFYKVPVDWGQQVYATADIGAAEGGADGTSGTDGSAGVGGAGGVSAFVVPALDLTLYNPVRAEVATTSIGYGGTQKSTSLAPLPPVAYTNRYAPTDPEKSLRFAGAHFLVVHLSAEVAERFGDGPYGLVLRVRVTGTARPGPGYAGASQPRGLFDVGAPDAIGSGGEGAAAGGGTAGDGASDGGDDLAMKAVAVGGIGTGSALLLVLGVWTVTARRRAASARGAQIRANAQNPTA